MVLTDEVRDAVEELRAVFQRAALDSAQAGDVEPALDLIERRPVSRREVNMETRSLNKPSTELAVL